MLLRIPVTSLRSHDASQSTRDRLLIKLAATAGVFLISPLVGRILDWHVSDSK